MSKVALVTGASSGIGEETANFLISAGYTVYAGARRVDRMKPLADRGARLLKLDVTDDESMVAAAETVLRETGRVNVLVNNAGYGSFGALEDVPIDEARRQLDVNIFGLARMAQLVLPTMRGQRSGKIVNIASVGGKIGEPFGSWYHATKFAVEGLSDALRMELRQFGIDVIIIEPGAIRSEWNKIARGRRLAALPAERRREGHRRSRAGSSTQDALPHRRGRADGPGHPPAVVRPRVRRPDADGHAPGEGVVTMRSAQQNAWRPSC